MTILLIVFFVMSVTASAVSAKPGKIGGIHGGNGMGGDYQNTVMNSNIVTNVIVYVNSIGNVGDTTVNAESRINSH
jgi:hypothetical protein